VDNPNTFNFFCSMIDNMTLVEGNFFIWHLVMLLSFKSSYGACHRLQTLASVSSTCLWGICLGLWKRYSPFVWYFRSFKKIFYIAYMYKRITSFIKSSTATINTIANTCTFHCSMCFFHISHSSKYIFTPVYGV